MTGHEGRFQRLWNGHHFEDVVAANRAYLAVAVPEAPRWAGERWVLTCLPSTRSAKGDRRLSAVNMRGAYLKEKHYRDVQHDGCQARGTVNELINVFTRPTFAIAVRALANSLLTSRTAYARFHNRYLAAAVVGGEQEADGSARTTVTR